MSIIALNCALIAIDGDTLRCGAERIRLLGIDAPEMPGHCHERRNCVPGDPIASKNALRNAPKGMQPSNVSGATYTTAPSPASGSTALICLARSSQAVMQSTVPTGISSPSSRRTAPAPLPRLRGLSAVRRGTRPFANRLPRRHWATGATAIVARSVELGLHRYAGDNQAMGRIWTATVMASPASRSDDR